MSNHRKKKSTRRITTTTTTAKRRRKRKTVEAVNALLDESEALNKKLAKYGMGLAVW